jgi:MFS transporter, SP family, general alpha glucoside:H+ symporter
MVAVRARFERKVNLRKFDKYVTDVQIRAAELHGDENPMA